MVKPHKRSIKPTQAAHSLTSQHSDVASQLGQHEHRLCESFWFLCIFCMTFQEALLLTVLFCAWGCSSCSCDFVERTLAFCALLFKCLQLQTYLFLQSLCLVSKAALKHSKMTGSNCCRCQKRASGESVWWQQAKPVNFVKASSHSRFFQPAGFQSAFAAC